MDKKAIIAANLVFIAISVFVWCYNKDESVRFGLGISICGFIFIIITQVRDLVQEMGGSSKEQLVQSAQMNVRVSDLGTSYVTSEDYQKFCKNNQAHRDELARLRDAGLVELGLDVFGVEKDKFKRKEKL